MKRYPFGKFLLDIPDDHKIVSIHREAAFYDRAFGFVIEEISRTSPDGVLLDIGGNIGDTAAFFASYVSNPIVSVEGNPDFTSYFKSNLRHFGEQVRLVEKFIRTDSLADLKLAYSGGAGTGVLSVTESDALDDGRILGLFDEARDGEIVVDRGEAEALDTGNRKRDRGDGDIRALFDVLVDDLAEIHAVELVTGEDQYEIVRKRTEV